jgi:GrpB-like predicted nucleotidyltransferase (UPF0157 family)
MIVPEGPARESGVERYGGGSIVVVDYEPSWPAMFDDERTRVEAALGRLVFTVEHVGSTAVPGLAAKPIIDLLVGVTSLAEVLPRGAEPLRALGYSYVPEYESWLPGERFFRKGYPGPWTYHMHVMEPANPRWPDRLLFRDHLRAHPEAAVLYAGLKRDLAAAFGDDIAGYRSAKDAFVAAVMAKARAEVGAA